MILEVIDNKHYSILPAKEINGVEPRHKNTGQKTNVYLWNVHFMVNSTSTGLFQGSTTLQVCIRPGLVEPWLIFVQGGKVQKLRCMWEICQRTWRWPLSLVAKSIDDRRGWAWGTGHCFFWLLWSLLDEPVSFLFNALFTLQLYYPCLFLPSYIKSVTCLPLLRPAWSTEG